MRSASAIYYRDLIYTLVVKELKVRYKSTFLGYVWSILNPLAFAAVYTFAFQIIMHNNRSDYILFFTSALFPWQWFSNSSGAANTYFLGNATLIKKVSFPRIFLVLAGVLNDSVHFLISIPVLVLIMLWKGHHPSFSWLYAMPLLFLTQMFITTGLCLIIATTNLFFRDLERLIGIILQLWMFLSPVLYDDKDMAARHLLPLLYANPMGPQIAAWRQLFMTGTLNPSYAGISAMWAVVTYFMGYSFYRSLQTRFAEVV